MAILSLCISCAALTFSLFTYFRHDRTLKAQAWKLNDIALREAWAKAEELRHAKIEAVITRDNNKPRLIVKNSGKAIARDIKLAMDPVWANALSIFPIEFLNPSENIGVNVYVGLTDPRKVKAMFTWKDDAGEQSHCQILLMT